MDYLYILKDSIIFLLVIFFFSEGFYPKLRRIIVILYFTYYFIDKISSGLSYEIIALLIFWIVLFSISYLIRLIKGNIRVVIQIVGCIVGLFFIFVINFLNSFIDNPETVINIENEFYRIETTFYSNGGAGIFSTVGGQTIFYIDKSEFFINRRPILNLDYNNNPKKFEISFINDSVISIDVNYFRHSKKVFLKPIEIDLANSPPLIEYDSYKKYYELDHIRNNKEPITLNAAMSKSYCVSIVRKRATENEILGEHIINYGSIYQKEAKPLFNINKDDFALFEFIDSQTVIINYLSNIEYPPDVSCNEFIYDNKHYNYTDSITVDLTNRPDVNLLLERKATHLHSVF